ncbi:hypothetical protein C8Q77DRAFT_613157 [Trametes polyzona]|nr:hypothetical protein C8Q77DRAFT_613157 [Trametes polyzona]
MPPPLHILLTSATGYIGGGVLGKLYSSVQAGEYTVTALVRSQRKALPFGQFGISTVVGTLDDFDVVAEKTAKADVVLHTASDEHIPAIESGARKRLEEGKQKTILLHTSGCGFAIDDEWEVFNENRVIYDDSDVEQY